MKLKAGRTCGEVLEWWNEEKKKCEFYTASYPCCNNPNSWNQLCDPDVCPKVIRRLKKWSLENED